MQEKILENRSFLEKLAELEKLYPRKKKELAEKLGLSYTHFITISNGNLKPSRQIEMLVDIYLCDAVANSANFSLDATNKAITLSNKRGIVGVGGLLVKLIDEAYARECASEPAGQLSPSQECPQKPITASPSGITSEQILDAAGKSFFPPPAPNPAPKKPVKK